MAAARTTISLPGKLSELAANRAKELHFATLSDYLQHLVREDVLREPRNDAQPLSDAPTQEPYGKFLSKPKKKVAG